MKFTLTIDCDSAAFQPVQDDASEPERYCAALRQVGQLLTNLGRATMAESAHLSASRFGFLRDTNGNRCGQWSLSSDDAEG